MFDSLFYSIKYIYIYLDFMIENMLLISKNKICLRYYYARK